jgi:hypothetical protein
MTGLAVTRSACSSLAFVIVAACPNVAQGAADGFRLFSPSAVRTWPGPAEQPESFSLDLAAFPGLAPFAPAPETLPPPPVEGAEGDTAPKKKKHLWAAVGEGRIVDLTIFAYNRFVRRADFAFVSPATWGASFRDHWVYDNDGFVTTQILHPYHGNLYFNAARVNGYNFWESMPFALGGSLFWMYFAEIGPVNYSDFVSTTWGGIVLGESFFRVSRMILDNSASGDERLLREVAAGLVSPTSLLDRLLRGQTRKQFQNPDDRLPSSFALSVDLGWRHVAGGVGVTHRNQGTLTVGLRYGDPFDGTPRRPFDYFETAVELQLPSKGIANRVDSRGSLVVGDVGSSERLQSRFGLFMGWSYLDDQVQVYSAPDLSGRFLSRLPLGNFAELRGELAFGIVPLGALQTEYPEQNLALTGRTFDFGPAGDVDVRILVRRRGVDLLTLGYQAVWMLTTNGVSHHNVVQFARVEARVPIKEHFAAGAAWAWDQRISTYDIYEGTRTSHIQLRAFASWTFP